MLVVLFLGQSGGALAGGFLQELLLYLPPWLSEAEGIFGQVGRLWSGPLVQIWCLPLPLKEVGNGGCNWALDGVPGMGFVAQVLVDARPGLLQVLNLIGGPSLVQRVNGLDVMDDDLVSWVEVLVAVEVKGGIK